MGYPKAQPAQKKVVDPVPHESGHTTPTTSDADAAPRLPHERDESSDSQISPPREVMKQAHTDVERGLVDTDRGPVLDQLYEERIRSEETAGRGAPSPSKP